MAHIALSSPFGPLTLFAEDGALVALEFGRAGATPRATPLLRRAAAQLTAYFTGAPAMFDLPLNPAGSVFQRRVWGLLSAIPWGGTVTYGALAAQLGSAARAVGGACARNPLPIIIPCHRIVGAGGRLGGYSAGAGLETKTMLLRLESKEGTV